MNHVLHLRSSAGFFGAERVLVTLLSRLPDLDVAPVLVTVQNYRNGNRDLLDCARQAGIVTLEIPCASRWSLSTLRHLRGVADRHRVECIHTHDYKSHAYGFVAARMLGLPIVATLHGWISSTRTLRLYQRLERGLLRWFDTVITVSPAMRDRLIGWGFQAQRVRTIGNGVDTDLFTQVKSGLGRQRWGASNVDYVFGTVARLSPEKGQSDLLEAFATVARMHDRVRLLLVGDGPDRAVLQRISRELGISNKVTFAGRQLQVDRILHDIDCYVSPSLTEGMPMIILEAMASGVPIIATDVGAVRAMLADGAGVLVPVRDTKALANAMRSAANRMLKADAAVVSARKRSVEIYSARAQAVAYARIYAELCK